MEAFGFNFIITNDVQQYLNPQVFTNGSWIHYCTIQRGLKEYMLFKHVKTGKMYLERMDFSDPNLFVKITDKNELEDLEAFLRDRGILIVGVDHEFKLADR